MGDLIDRAPGDDVIVAVRMRRSSFEKLTSRPDGRSVEVSAGAIGLVPDEPDDGGNPVFTFTVWSGEPVWHGVPEQIPGNQEAADALKPVDMRYLMFDDDDEDEDYH